jgi:hypothetical protein
LIGHGSVEVHGVGIVMSRLAFPKATVSYFTIGYVEAEAIMVVVPEMM